MFYLKVILVIIASVLLESQVPLYWDAFRYVDLPLLVTVYFALMRDPVLGMLVGFAAGLSGDVAPGSGPVIGIGGFTKTLIGFVVATVGVRFSLEGPLVRVLVIAVSSLVNSLLFVGLHGVMSQEVAGSDAPDALFLKVAFETAANLVFGVIIFWLLDKIFPEATAGSQMRVRRKFYD